MLWIEFSFYINEMLGKWLFTFTVVQREEKKDKMIEKHYCTVKFRYVFQT